MSLPRCPTCGKAFDPKTAAAMPFCSERCRKIDLNRWLSEEIALPASEAEADESEREKPAKD